MIDFIFGKVLITAFLVLVLFIGLFTSCNNRELEGTDADYINSYYVMTKDADNDKISYYEVSNNGEKSIEEKRKSLKMQIMKK